MAYLTEIKAGESIEVKPGHSANVKITLEKKSGQKARIRVESDEDYQLEPKRSRQQQAR